MAELLRLETNEESAQARALKAEPALPASRIADNESNGGLLEVTGSLISRVLIGATIIEAN